MSEDKDESVTSSLDDIKLFILNQSVNLELANVMDDNKLFNNTETETFKYATTAEKRNQEKYQD